MLLLLTQPMTVCCNTDYTKKTLDVKSIHFGSRPVLYTNFSLFIIGGKCGMSGDRVEGKSFMKPSPRINRWRRFHRHP